MSDQISDPRLMAMVLVLRDVFGLSPIEGPYWYDEVVVAKGVIAAIDAACHLKEDRSMTIEKMATARLIDRLLGLPHNRDFAAIDKAIAYVRQHSDQTAWIDSNARRLAA